MTLPFRVDLTNPLIFYKKLTYNQDMKYVYLMTKNKGKIAAAQSIFDKYKIEVRSLDFDIPEIQADSSIEIAKNTVL